MFSVLKSFEKLKKKYMTYIRYSLNNFIIEHYIVKKNGTKCKRSINDNAGF